MHWREQLPKYHPLHKEPEERRMNPGTERALVVLVENQMPRLAKAIDALTAAVTAAAAELNKEDPPVQPGAAESQVAALSLTKEQWIELVEAIASKAAQVRDGRYGNAPDNVDADKWADDLDKLFQDVSSALEDQGISL